ncbi:MAG: acetylxylan esterase [Clostridia bacterium]|nr:acetylxylan esterase [Clostridia bacterium]
MPLVDMPLEELKKYQGRNPKPADFDKYWDDAIAEMNSIDPNPQFILADVQFKNVECYDLYFTGTKGARVYAKFYKPKNIVGKAPAVLKFHGYEGNSGQWIDHLGYAGDGFVTAALDCRGQYGKSQDSNSVEGTTFKGHIIRGLSSDNPHDLLFRDVFLDTALLARIVMSLDYVDENRVGCCGGSQGGALTIACASLVPEIKIAAPEFPFLCDYKRVWEMDLATTAYGELKEYFRAYDPLHKHEDEIFTKLGYIDLQYLAPRIKAETTMFTGLMDTTCPPSTQFAAYNKMTCKKDFVIWPDFGHEGLPGVDDMMITLMHKL